MTVLHTHVQARTLREMSGLIDVGEKSFDYTVQLAQGIYELETMWEYTTQQPVGGLVVHNPTVESMTALGHQIGTMDSLQKKNGSDVEGKCSGFMPEAREKVLSLMPTMTSCCTMWETGIGCRNYPMNIPQNEPVLDHTVHLLHTSLMNVEVKSSKSGNSRL